MKVYCEEEFRKELPVFQEMTERFYSKDITSKDYKGFSGRYGSYAQRGGGASMLRLRMSGGVITKEKLKFIVNCVSKYQIDKLHFTTCQTVQLHNLDKKAVCEIMEEAIDCGIITWGGGGDFPRNVMVSPLAGVEVGEFFDVMPYVQSAADYLLSFINTVKLPRKLKVGFSNSPANVAHATFRDLGFAATAEKTFDVYSAGGLGPNPKKGICVARGVEPEMILYYIKAMADTFVAYGNYENRAKARTRYMQDSLGQEGYVEAYKIMLEKALVSGEDLMLDVKSQEAEPGRSKSGDGCIITGSRIVPQKQSWLYAVHYHPIGGSPAPEKLGEIYKTIKDMDQVELRLTPNEGLYVINCTGDEAERLRFLTNDGAQNLFETSVACIGASICQIGVQDSQKLLQSLVKATNGYGFADGVLPQIHISGCPSSCGTHQIGILGFRGLVKMIENVPHPAFSLQVGGCEVEGKEVFGEQWGTMLAEDIPKFMIELGECVAMEHTIFSVWIQQHRGTLRDIAEKYLR